MVEACADVVQICSRSLVRLAFRLGKRRPNDNVNSNLQDRQVWIGYCLWVLDLLLANLFLKGSFNRKPRDTRPGVQRRVN